MNIKPSGKVTGRERKHCFYDRDRKKTSSAAAEVGLAPREHPWVWMGIMAWEWRWRSCPCIPPAWNGSLIPTSHSQGCSAKIASFAGISLRVADEGKGFPQFGGLCKTLVYGLVCSKRRKKNNQCGLIWEESCVFRAWELQR